MTSRLLTLRNHVCTTRLFPTKRSITDPWPRLGSFAISRFSTKHTPRRAVCKPNWIFFASFATALGVYNSSTVQQSLLCEAPASSDNNPDEKFSGTYEYLHTYPTFKYINGWFTDHGFSTPGEPGKGLLRSDGFSMAAETPQEYIIAASTGDRDVNGFRLPDGLSWASFGVVDGHRYRRFACRYVLGTLTSLRSGPYTAEVVREVLPEYIIGELFIQAGINPYSPYNDDRFIFQNRSLQDIVRAISDAFERLDYELLKKAVYAIVGSRPLQASMQDIAPAESGCSVVLATYDTASQHLFVANVGNCRAVLGHMNAQGSWEASQLSVDHTCQNEDEVARLRAEHPNEADVIKDGQLLGSKLTRAFGDLRWKSSAKLQSIAHARLFGQPLLPSFLSPPYISARPSVSATKIDPNENDFVILASDGLWDRMTNEQAVRLVGLWLAKNDPSKSPKDGRLTNPLDLVVQDPDENPQRFGMTEYQERLQQGLLVVKTEDLPAPGREYTKTVKHVDEKNWVVVDDNVATHLARNALGGADEDIFCALVGASSVYPMRRLRDDITIQIIFFGYGDSKSLDLNITSDDPDSSDTLDLV
ncbi:MAG: hypothetical protein Q9226_007752 [Calogaya cf. arnoldii]